MKDTERSASLSDIRCRRFSRLLRGWAGGLAERRGACAAIVDWTVGEEGEREYAILARFRGRSLVPRSIGKTYKVGKLWIEEEREFGEEGRVVSPVLDVAFAKCQ